MGGRRGWRRKRGNFSESNTKARGYDVVTSTDEAGRFYYPELDALGAPYTIVTFKNKGSIVKDGLPIDPQHTFDQSPTWILADESKITHIYVQNQEGQQFEDHQVFETAIGVFPRHRPGAEATMFKRMRRAALRRYEMGAKLYTAAAGERVRDNELRVGYVDISDRDTELRWDGNAVFNRSVLDRLETAPGLSDRDSGYLEHEKRSGSRIEFTLGRVEGQFKGHAHLTDRTLIDNDGREIDVLIPYDPKTQVKGKAGVEALYVNMVHGSDRVVLDSQSMTNLATVIPSDQLAQWDNEHTAHVEENVMARADAFGPEMLGTVITDPVTEFELLGGDTDAIDGMVRGKTDQIRSGLIYTPSDDMPSAKLRVRIPGVRRYISSETVGRVSGEVDQAGVDQGKILIQKDSVFFNQDDWTNLPDSSIGAGVVDVLGGADQDDSVVMLGVTNQETGEKEIVLWRNPNEPGEYLRMGIQEGSDLSGFEWQTVDGPYDFPELDLSTLPQRKDDRSLSYSFETLGGASAESHHYRPYRPDAMESAADRLQHNASAIPAIAFVTKHSILLTGEQPAHLPAPQELVMDTTKTGEDARPIIRESVRMGIELLNARGEDGHRKYKFPKAIAHEANFYLNVLPRNEVMGITGMTQDEYWDLKLYVQSGGHIEIGDHWMNRITNNRDRLIKELNATEQALLIKAQLPDPVIDSVMDHAQVAQLPSNGSETWTPEQLLQAGQGLDQTYARELSKIRRVRRRDAALVIAGTILRPNAPSEVVARTAEMLVNRDPVLNRDELRLARASRHKRKAGLTHKEQAVWEKLSVFNEDIQTGILKESRREKMEGKIKLGAERHKQWRELSEPTTDDHHRARLEVQKSLTDFVPEVQERIVLANMVFHQLSGNSERSTAMFKKGVKLDIVREDESVGSMASSMSTIGVGHVANRAFKRLGLLNERTVQPNRPGQEQRQFLPRDNRDGFNGIRDFGIRQRRAGGNYEVRITHVKGEGLNKVYEAGTRNQIGIMEADPSMHNKRYLLSPADVRVAERDQWQTVRMTPTDEVIQADAANQITRDAHKALHGYWKKATYAPVKLDDLKAPIPTDRMVWVQAQDSGTIFAVDRAGNVVGTLNDHKGKLADGQQIKLEKSYEVQNKNDHYIISAAVVVEDEQFTQERLL